MGKYIEVPDSLMREMLEALLNWYPKGSEALADVPEAFIDAFIEMMKDAGGCDHSVGICACEEEAIARELLLLKDGKATCRQCGGDGFAWDEAKYEAERGKYEEAGYAPDSCGYVNCPGCDGKGITRIGKEEAKVLAALPPDPGYDHLVGP